MPGLFGRRSPQIRIPKNSSRRYACQFCFKYPDVNPWHVKIRILPYEHKSRFDEISEEEAESLAAVLHQTMKALGRKYPNCGYNFELRQGPWKLPEHYGRIGVNPNTYHWGLSVYPASSDLDTMRQDGFMSHLLGMAVLTDTPETFASKLRAK